MGVISAEDWEFIKNVAAGVGGFAALVTIIAGLATLAKTLLPHLWAWRNRYTLKQRLGAELYDAEEIRRATTFYIRPHGQSVDPSGGEDFRRVVSTREPLFSTIDRFLENPREHKFVILLADSGMGKTSLLLNYTTVRLKVE